MSRWGRRKPANCTTLQETYNNVITGNTILNTREYGMKMGDCVFGACRPIRDSRITGNSIESNTGVLVHYNNKNEPGRSTVCDASTMDRKFFFDKPGDADGGVNTGIIFDGNTYSPAGDASLGKGFDLDQNAILRE